jgi:hypothetical protein
MSRAPRSRRESRFSPEKIQPASKTWARVSRKVVAEKAGSPDPVETGRGDLR